MKLHLHSFETTVGRAATLALLAHGAFGCSDADAPAESTELLPASALAARVSADATVYALATGGRDTPCGTLNMPCSSLQAAADQLSLRRPHLVLLPSTGVFQQGVSLPDIGAPLHVIGNDVHVSTSGASGFLVAGGQVTFDSVFVENVTDPDGAAIACTGGSILVRDSTLRASSSGIKAEGCDVELNRTLVAANEMGIQARSGLHGLDVSQCKIEGNAQAIYSDADPLTIQNNLFLRNGDHGYTRVVELVNRTGTAFFGYNTLVGNFNNCIYVGIVACNGVDATLTSNISWDNFPSSGGRGTDCLEQVFSCRDLTMSNTIAERSWPGAGNSTLDPLFVDPANDDYRLNPGSPAIGQGNPALAPARDYYGIARPEFAPPDIGAIEYGPRELGQAR
jgi:hypothetical protein